MGTSPKVPRHFTRDWATLLPHFSPNQQCSDYFQRNASRMGFIFYLLHPDRSPFLTGAQEPPLVQTRVGVSRMAPLPPGSSFSFFFSFSLLNPPFPLQAHWDPFVHKRWGVSPFVESARAVPFRSRTRGMTLQSGSSFFLFSFAD
jgi:hypothetical protein